jgi:hypothetical protein
MQRDICRSVCRSPTVRHENVDTPQCIDCLSHELHRSFVGCNVMLDTNATVANGLDCVPQTLFVAAADHDLCTVARKADGRGQAQSGGSRRDDCPFSGDTEIHVPTLFARR